MPEYDFIDRRPLSDDERRLIAAAENEPWTPSLRELLAHAVGSRGIPTIRFDDCGSLAEQLRDAGGES